MSMIWIEWSVGAGDREEKVKEDVVQCGGNAVELFGALTAVRVVSLLPSRTGQD